MNIKKLLLSIKSKKYYTPKGSNITLITVVEDDDKLFIEFILEFKHTSHIRWLIPDVEPTQKYIRFPITMLIEFKCKKHYTVSTVLWNHACVLYQLNLIKKTTLLRNCIIGSEICDCIVGNIHPIISNTDNIIVDNNNNTSCNKCCNTILTKEEIQSLWTEHVQYEFIEKDAKKLGLVLSNDSIHIDIATMMGGNTKKTITGYYTYDFIPCLPEDNKTDNLHVIIGNNSLIEILNWTFTHSIPMNFMLPGINPTNKKVSITVVAIAKFNGCGKMISETVYWDQNSLLQQLGLLKN